MRHKSVVQAALDITRATWYEAARVSEANVVYKNIAECTRRTTERKL